jgi:hypothetical protein
MLIAVGYVWTIVGGTGAGGIVTLVWSSPGLANMPP